jgi:ABC-2 type transport system permease protein
METTLTPTHPLSSLSRTSLAAELRALLAVVRREWLHFVRYPTWMIALIIWPVIFPAAYMLSARALAGPDGSGLQRFLQTAGTDNFLGYIVIGTSGWMWFNTMLWNVGFAMRGEQLHGTLESSWLSPTWRFSFLLGVAPVQSLMMFIFVTTMIVEHSLFFGLHFNGNLLLTLLVILASYPAIYGMGFAFASLVTAAREANAFVFLVRGVVMIFCGITYPLSVLPGWMQSVSQWLPPTIMIRAARNAALNAYSFEALLPDLARLLLFGAFWLTAGYLLFVWTERRARRLGTLNQF